MQNFLSLRHLSRTNLILAVCVCLVTAAHAQLELGLGGGISRYEGDMGPQGSGAPFKHNGPSFTLYGRAPLGDFLAVRVFYQQGRISGADADRTTSRSRNLSFESKLQELAAVVEVHPLRITSRVSPYFFAGGSVYHFDPKTEYQGQEIALQPLGTEGQGRPGFEDRYALTRFSVPLGIGVRYGLTDKLSIGLDLSTRLTFFDHLDDVSGRYADPSVFAGDESNLAQALADRSGELTLDQEGGRSTGEFRGDSSDADWLFLGHVTIGWRLSGGGLSGLRRGSRSEKCYEF